MAGILVYVLEKDGEFNKNSLGAVSEAAKLAGQIGGEAAAVVVGDVPDDKLATLGAYGAAKVFKVNGAAGLAQPAVDALETIIKANGYNYALFGGGLLGFEIS